MVKDPADKENPLTFSLKQWPFNRTWFQGEIPELDTMLLDETATLICRRFNEKTELPISANTRMNIMLTKIKGKTVLEIVAI